MKPHELKLFHASAMVLRTENEVLTDEGRRDLLERSYRGEHIELLLDFVAFRQAPGERNRNCVRFEEGILESFAGSGTGTPFLRNHGQWNVADRGGTIVSSVAATRGGGAVEFEQTARLTVPWAVQGALQRNFTGFSIGWSDLPAPGALSPVVKCSVCNDSIDRCFWRRGHYRGAEDDGQIVEFIFTNAELIETSAVNVPAVPETRAVGVGVAERLALDAKIFGVAAPRHRSRNMDKVKQVLGLDQAAGEDEMLAAVEALNNALSKEQDKAKGLAKKLEEAEASAAELAARLGSASQELAQQKAERLLEAAVQEGKIEPEGALADHVRGLAAQDYEAAEKLLTEMPRRTPVGATLQSGCASTPPSGEPDYAALAQLLDNDDLAVAKRARVTPEQYVRANYKSLATQYGWPA